MSTFVLVHGAWHGGWVWERVVPLLQKAGHEVVTLDLPGHGDDQTPPGEVTLDGYAERVVGVLDSLEGPLILVGHSMGGAVISEAAERRPERVELLVYLTAFLLPNGTSLLDMAQTDVEAAVDRSLDIDESKGVGAVRADMAKDLFYGECSAEDAAWATARLQGQPLAPWGTPVSTTESNFGLVPRVYVTCLRDQAITPTQQREMYTQTPCREVVTFDTDHSPMLSRPAELTRYLVSLAAVPGDDGRSRQVGV